MIRPADDTNPEQWRGRMQTHLLVPSDEPEVRFDFIAVHLRLRRNARRAWALTAFLLLCAAATCLAYIWTGDVRFEATTWVVFTLMLPAGLAGASFSGRAERIEKSFADG